MASLPDLSTLTFDQRLALADKVKKLPNFNLPSLKYWNTAPCDAHAELVFSCKRCGVKPLPHQAVGSTWLYFAKKGLLADTVGTGKTASIALLIAMMAEAGELESRKVVIALRSAAMIQWQQELYRMMPNLSVITATGTVQQRLNKYVKPWSVLLIGKEMVLKDWEALEQFPLAAVIMDDVDAIRNPTRIAHALKRLSRNADRVVVANGTPLMKKLPELYHTLEPVGGKAVFGTKGAFKARYTGVDDTGQTTYHNIEEFKRKLSPFVLRRTTDDIDGVEMPAVISSTVWLDLHAPQRAKYEELRAGVLKILKESGAEEIKRIQAIQKFHYGAAVCSGLAAIGEEDLPGQNSIKLDWLLENLEGDLSEDKVIAFIGTKNLLRAAEARLETAQIKTAKIWGDNNNRTRQEQIKQFWEDDECRVMLMTQAGESSLNLQNARHVVFVDTIINQARMEQIMGRVRRQGSVYKTVYAHHLLTTDTQEARYLEILRKEAALASTVWNSESQIFQALSPLELMQLIVS